MPLPYEMAYFIQKKKKRYIKSKDIETKCEVVCIESVYFAFNRYSDKHGMDFSIFSVPVKTVIDIHVFLFNTKKKKKKKKKRKIFKMLFNVFLAHFTLYFYLICHTCN